MAVPAGTFMIMFYDTWHRATSSTNESDMHLTPVDRDPTDTRWMCKFRFWRMEEPSRPTWLHDPDRAFEPPLDEAQLVALWVASHWLLRPAAARKR